MANEGYVALLKQGTARWNAWRRDNLEVRPDFSGADLRGVNFTRRTYSGSKEDRHEQ
jgi:hypothetical protein